MFKYFLVLLMLCNINASDTETNDDNKTTSKPKSSFSGRWLAFSVGIGHDVTKHKATSGERYRLNNHEALAKKAKVSEVELYPNRCFASGNLNPRFAFEYRSNYGEIISGVTLAVDTTLFNKSHRDNQFYMVASDFENDANFIARIDERNAITPTYYFKRQFGTNISWQFGVDITSDNLKDRASGGAYMWVAIGLDCSRWKCLSTYENKLEQKFANDNQDIAGASAKVIDLYAILAKIKDKQKVTTSKLITSWGLSAGLEVAIAPGYNVFVIGQWWSPFNSLSSKWNVSDKEVSTKTFTITENTYKPSRLGVAFGVKIHL